MKNIVYLIAVCLFPMLSLAQDKSEPKLWSYNATFGFTYNDGNTNTSQIHLGLNGKYEKEKNIFELDLDGNRGTNDDAEEEITEKDLRITASHKYIYSKKWFLGLSAEAFYDDVADVDFRYTFLPSVGYFLIKEDKDFLSIEAGPGYVIEKLAGVREENLSPQFKQELSIEITPTAKINQKANYLFNVEDTEDFIFIFSAGIETKINDLLSLEFSAENQNVGVPAAGAERNDLAVITSLKVNI